MDRRRLVGELEEYFERSLEEHGPSPRGVDWKSDEAQTIRFHQLARIVDRSEGSYSLLDYGCGYGALAAWLRERGDDDFSYVGYDVSRRMLEVARRDDPAWRYTSDEAELESVDYVVASGVFNLRFEVPDEEWIGYIWETLDKLARLARRGFAFNMLSSYSDLDKRRADLFYGDSCALFDGCKRKYAPNVALLHDYGHYEFTILVRK